MHVDELAAPPRLLRLSGRAVLGLGQGEAQLLRHQADGLGKTDVLDLLHEAENVAGNAAAKAMIELARGVDGKRRRLLLVERTQPGKVLRSRLLQLDVVAHNADDIRLLLDRECEIAGVSHLLFRSLCLKIRTRGMPATGAI